MQFQIAFGDSLSPFTDDYSYTIEAITDQLYSNQRRLDWIKSHTTSAQWSERSEQCWVTSHNIFTSSKSISSHPNNMYHHEIHIPCKSSHQPSRFSILALCQSSSYKYLQTCKQLQPRQDNLCIHLSHHTWNLVFCARAFCCIQYLYLIVRISNYSSYQSTNEARLTMNTHPKLHPEFKYFYISRSLPSALFATLESAENSAELQLSSHITFYRINPETHHISFIYTSHKDS